MTTKINNDKFILSDIKEEAIKFNYEILSKNYINTHTKLCFLCPSKHSFGMSWNSFKRGARCPVCCGNQKLDLNLLKEIAKEYNLEITSNDYINNKSKLEFKCFKGHIFLRTWDKFKKTKNCPECSNTKKYTHAEKLKILEKKNIKFLDEGNILHKEKQMFLCSFGHKFISSFALIQQNHTCSQCNKYRVKKSDYVKNIIESFNGYKFISDVYKNTSSKLKIICPENHTFETTLHNFQQGKRCKLCYQKNRRSKGEIKIEKFLINHNVAYYTEHKFKDCKHINILSFDFYLPEYYVCIEFQGIQHYENERQFGKNKQKTFENQQIRDQIKRDYCLKNNIKLLEIPYWDFDKIEQILTQFVY